MEDRIEKIKELEEIKINDAIINADGEESTQYLRDAVSVIGASNEALKLQNEVAKMQQEKALKDEEIRLRREELQKQFDKFLEEKKLKEKELELKEKELDIRKTESENALNSACVKAENDKKVAIISGVCNVVSGFLRGAGNVVATYAHDKRMSQERALCRSWEDENVFSKTVDRNLISGLEDKPIQFF